MKAFACGDVVPGCDAHWISSDDDAVLARVADHLRAVHGLAEIPAEFAAAVRTHVVSTP
jgi:predicted small metal-binding protein